MEKQIKGIALILLNILLTISFGNEPVFDLSFRWSVIFSLLGVYGTVMVFNKYKR